jgi:predicted small secreted protein
MCKLYKVKADGSAGQKLSDQEPLNINIAGEWIYFCSESDNYSIYRIKTDGSSEKRISKVRAYCMSIAGDWIYYINAEDNKIYKMKFDGSKNTKVGGNGVARFNIVGTDIYYVKENSGIFKLMLNNASGKSAGADSNIIKEKVKDFIVQNNSIYYIDEKNNLKLYSWRPDKKGKTVKIADKITKFNIDNGYIYYVKEEHQDYTHREEVYDCENDSLWKVKCSGGKPEMLYKRDYDQIVYIYNVNIIDGLPYIEFQCENYYTNDGGQVVEGKSITSAGCIRVCM